jgi:hypothetical protein
MNPIHPSNDSVESRELNRVRELLPWYANGTLAPEQLAFIHAWLERNMSRHPDINAELVWLRRTASQLQSQPAPQASDAGLPDLLRRIAQEQATQRQPKPWGARLTAWINQMLGVRSPALAFGVAAVLCVQAGIIGILLMQSPAEQMPLSGAPHSVAAPKGIVLLTVAFQPHATELAMRTVLSHAHAQILAGPSALGLYTVAVPSAEADVRIAQLQQASEVVESVQR